MKKVLLAFVLVFMSVMVLQVNVLATGCETNPQFCLGDPGGDGTAIPDNYLVDTGLVATIVNSKGFNVGQYALFVRANNVSIDLNTSELFFKVASSSNLFLTDEYIQNRNPYGTLSSAGTYYLAQGINKTYFEQNSQYVGVSVSGYTTLVRAVGGGFINFSCGQPNQNQCFLPNAYYHEQSGAVMVSQYNGLNGFFGRYVYAKLISNNTFSDYRVLGWSRQGYDGNDFILLTTTYTNYNSLPLNNNKLDLQYVIVINK